MKSTLHVLAVVAAIFGLSHGTKIQKCDGDDAPEVDTLTVKIGSCGDERCVLKRGETYNYMAEFKAAQDDDDVKSFASGKAFGLELPLSSVTDNEACKSIQKKDKKTEKGKACPLKKGTDYIYQKDIKISEDEFTTKADVEWYLYSDKEVLYCFKVPVEVK